MKSKPFRALLALALCLFVCIGMNISAFLIDSEAMRSNAHQAMRRFSGEGATPQLIGGYKSAQLDNYTSVLMLKTAAYNGPESLPAKAFGGLRIDLPTAEGQSDWDAFCTYAENADQRISGLAYARYWHGYTFLLRLMLCFFDASNLQMLLYFAQTLLFALVCALSMRRCAAALPGFVTAFFLLMPAASGTCLQYAPATLLMLLACVLLLAADEQIDRAIGMPAFFALTGLMTNYLDLLTSPLITLGFPLIFHACLRLGQARSTRELAAEGVICSIAWGAGYAGMWALKFLLCALCFGPDYLAVILEQMTLRVSTQSGGADFSRLDAVRQNFGLILSKSAYLAALLLGSILALVPGAMRRRFRARKGLPILHCRALLLLLPALIPIAWYMVMANHSLDHTYFTYRNATVTVFAAFAALSHFIAPCTAAAPGQRQSA